MWIKKIKKLLEAYLYRFSILFTSFILTLSFPTSNTRMCALDTHIVSVGNGVKIHSIFQAIRIDTKRAKPKKMKSTRAKLFYFPMKS